MSFQWGMRYVNPYELHKQLINEYILKRPEDLTVFKRDTSCDRTDYDVIKENHRFLWDEDNVTSWEEQLAKKYYDRLFKEYCIGDLSRYKENKIALRWRIQGELIEGKGQFICGNKKCIEQSTLRTWEVNFAYQEKGEKKNALVKIRLCPSCSKKLNCHSKKREIKRLERKSKKRERDRHEEYTSHDSQQGKDQAQGTFQTEDSTTAVENCHKKAASSLWESQNPVEAKSREDEMEEYLQELLL